MINWIDRKGITDQKGTKCISHSQIREFIISPLVRKWPFNTGGGKIGGGEYFGTNGGWCFVIRPWRMGGWIFYTSQANIFKNLELKGCFMKNNWIWVYKTWWGGWFFFLHIQEGLDFFVHMKGGLYFVYKSPNKFSQPPSAASIKQPLPYFIFLNILNSEAQGMTKTLIYI